MGVTTFMLAERGTSLDRYFLMTPAQTRGAQRRGSAGDGMGSSAGYDSGGGSSNFSWFGGDQFPQLVPAPPAAIVVGRR